METQIPELIERAEGAVELEGTLGYLEESAVEEGERLHKALLVLKHTDGDVCLRCSKPEGEIFFRYVDGGLEEIGMANSRAPPSRPQPADPARTEAALKTADSIELVPVEATPFAPW